MLKIIFLFLLPSFCLSQIISEFKAAPPSNEPEWIEIFNNTNKDIDLNELSICDSRSCKQINGVLKSGEYLVLCKEANKLLEIYPIEKTSIIEQSLPTLNNTTDEIIIKSDNRTIDSLYYDLDDFDSYLSIERVDPDIPAIEINNLKNSINEFGASPGRANSHQPKNIDLTILNIKELDHNYELCLSNLGKNSAENTYLRIEFRDSLIYEELIQSIGSRDKLYLTFKKDEFEIDMLGSIPLKAIVFNNSDEIASNDTITFYYHIPIPTNAFKINEIMFDTDDNHSEYIELYNNSDYEISLEGVLLGDETMYKKNSFEGISEGFLKKDDYFLLASDTSIFHNFNLLDSNKIYFFDDPTLNNNSDLLILKDPVTNQIIDSFSYSSSIHSEAVLDQKNTSIERIDQEGEHFLNWSSSASSLGGTPLARNSISELITKGGLQISPRTFSPKGILNSNKCKIMFILPYKTSRVSLKVFHNSGRLVRTITSGKYSGPSGIEYWDGMTDNEMYARSGPYIIMLEAFDLTSNNVFKEKILVAIAY